jgi:hypothetical protein
VDHRVHFLRGERLVQTGGVQDVARVERQVRRLGGAELLDAAQGLLAGVVEVVHHDHLASSLEELKASVRADVAGAAGHEDGASFHGERHHERRGNEMPTRGCSGRETGPIRWFIAARGLSAKMAYSDVAGSRRWISPRARPAKSTQKFATNVVGGSAVSERGAAPHGGRTPRRGRALPPPR